MSPIPMLWKDGAMTPLPSFARKAADAFNEGEVYPMVEHVDRSRKSHDHYFVLVGEAWASLPEHMTDRFPTADHLRRWALIKAGFRDERTIVCSSKAEATRVKSFIRPLDEFAVILSSGAVVTAYTAKSQSMKAMGRAMFQDSKDKTLAVIADLIGVSPAVLSKQTEAA
jgi:hypothetical protein